MGSYFETDYSELVEESLKFLIFIFIAVILRVFEELVLKTTSIGYN
jgi:hypothetical protein